MASSIEWLTALELRALYRRAALSPVEVAETAFARIERYNGALNAFMVIDREGAMAQAQASAARWRRGTPLSPLDGVPVTIKDTVDLQGFPTRAGSQTTPDAPAAHDCPEAARLREAGCVILGKTTTPEFGWKGMTDGPLFGTTRNPWNLERTPGGSSGGAAAALAAGIGTLALGTDGGGSVRIPATHCGLFGLKPTFGRVPHAPHKGAFGTLVAAGPITRSVSDAALMLNEMARPDPRDWYALPYTGEDFGADLWRGVDGLKIAVTTTFGGAQTDPEVATLVQAAARVLEQLGAIVEEVGEITAPLRPRFEAYWLAGFGETLARIPPARWPELDPGFLELARRGQSVTRAEAYAGELARIELGTEMALFHQRHDLLLMPTIPAPPVNAAMPYHAQGNDRWARATPFTVAFNYTGQPCATIRCGFTSDGLPAGLQIVGPKYSEGLILRAAAAYEAASQASLWPTPALAASLKKMAVDPTA
ncbi:amidase [Vineibacter terrae]|uniref:amidase n=1 Tax=Vineibacter terrae TaxID=2586908 RepID=UPI002E307FAB|nr:amidase [Vineibacter terrae]HEX2890528.1 amidase [Vineibacter terrae]